MSLFQSDVDRQGKIVIAGCAILIVALGYIAYGYIGASRSQATSLSPIQAGHGVASDESEHYGEVLRRYNRSNAASALQTGDSYLSTMSSRTEPVPQASSRQQAAAADPAPPATPSLAAQQVIYSPPVPDARSQERIAEQFAALAAEWSPAAHSKARVGEVLAPAYPQQAAERASGAGARSPLARRVVPAFLLVPAVLGTDIDTDENSWVRARIAAGDYTGAVLHAPGYRRNNNTVEVGFAFMEWQGRVYKVNAKAVDKDSMRTNLSGEVNNRYWSRIVLPALALGLGRAGQLYEQADTQTSYSPLGGVLQTRSGSPSGKAVSGTIVGGMASEAGRVLQADAGQLPSKQVLISKSSAIGIQFLEPVLSTDDVESTPAPAPDGAQASQLSVRPLPPLAPPSPVDPEFIGASPYLRPAESKLTGQ